MTVSSARTVVIGAPNNFRNYGIQSGFPAHQWPVKQPDEYLDYSVDVTNLLADVTDTISSVEVSMSPSNETDEQAIGLSYTIAYLGVPTASDGSTPTPTEAQPLSVSAAGNVITTWIAGGVPQRFSLVKIGVETSGGRSFEVLVGFRISPVLATGPLLPPDNPGFCDPLYWESQTFNFGIPSDSQYLAII